MTKHTTCPHGETPRHACLTGEHQCETCGMVSGHTVGCPVYRASLTPEERARLDVAMEPRGETP